MHDRNGRELKVGDIVLVPCRIDNIAAATEEFCNVGLKTVFGRRPDNQQEYYCTNTGVVLRANPGDENDLAEIQG
jgi:hypothetical protein